MGIAIRGYASVVITILCLETTANADTVHVSCDAARQAYGSGNFEEAVSHYTVCLENTEYDLVDWAAIYQGRGLAYLSSRQLTAATEDLLNALTLDVDNASINHDVGLAYLEQGAAAHALTYLERSIELDPSVWKTYYTMGLANEFTGNVVQAMHDFDRALDGNPDHLPTLFARGGLHTRLGQCHDAITDFHRVLELDPSHAEAYYWRAFCWNELKAPDLAISDLDSHLSLIPNDMWAYAERGRSRLMSDDTVGALRDFRSAENLGPDQPFLLVAMAWSLYEAGVALEDALTLTREANRLYPDDPVTLDILAHILAALGQPTEAMAAYQQVFHLARYDHQLYLRYHEQLKRHGYDPLMDPILPPTELYSALGQCISDACNIWLFEYQRPYERYQW